MISPLFLTLLIILIIFSKSHDNHHFDHTDHNSTSMHDEYKKVCGWTWQQDFIAQQELIRNGQLSPKFIIAIPTDYGFADLVHGYVAAFVIALATNRAFLIAHVIDGAYAQNSIAFGYHSPYIVSRHIMRMCNICVVYVNIMCNIRINLCIIYG